MKDARSEKETVMRGLMKELAVFTQAVESRHKYRGAIERVDGWSSANGSHTNARNTRN